VSLPGPSAGPWIVGLLVWAAAAAVLGESLRLLTARYVAWWRSPDPIQRGLLDFYLGGAVLYLVAALPFGWFLPPVVDGLPILGAVGVILHVARGRRTQATARTLASLRALMQPAYLVVLGSGLALLVFEVLVAAPIPTGNTFDSGLLTTYSAILLRTHSIAYSLQPYASTAVLYPQGAPVWVGWAQEALLLPPARASLIVTPLFFALAPLAGFVFGRRWFSSDRAGVGIALTLAWLAPATRGLVSGSNDFVFAFPLVLLLAAEGSQWARSVSSWGDSVGFGILVGYSAAMNPVGAEWLLPALLITGLLALPYVGRTLIRWLARWGVAVVISFLGVIPSLVVLVRGHASPGFVPGAAAPPVGSPTGLSTPQFLGSIDPFLFGSSDVQLSPVPALRLELAILLVVGLAILILVTREGATGRFIGPFRTFAIGSFVALLAGLGVIWWASTGFGPAIAFGDISSAAELSLWLFTLYVFIAALPLVIGLDRLGSPEAADPSSLRAKPTSTSSRRFHARSELARTVLPLAVALVIVVPGVTLTPTSFAPVLTRLYQEFGNVTTDDLALLDYAGSHLPSGARVLVAPGSAADFLPGYAADVVLLYPLIPGWPWVNASYTLLVRQLSNGTLDAQGFDALANLNVTNIVVTGNSTVLWPAFSPRPLLADPSEFPVLWHQGDAFLFARA
jgi:hypothetical protein